MKLKAATAVFMLAAAVPLGKRVDLMAQSLRIPVTGADRVLAARVAEKLEARRATADMKWIDILQYCGDVSFTLEKGAKLPALSESLTDVDPGFVQGFMYLGPMLMWQCGLPEKAAMLLKKGIRYNPEQQKLQLYLAAITYCNDLENEIAVLEKLAFAAEAPFMLRRILSNAYAKQGKIRHAAAICRLILETTSDTEERRWAELKLERYSRKIGEIQ